MSMLSRLDAFFRLAKLCFATPRAFASTGSFFDAMFVSSDHDFCWGIACFSSSRPSLRSPSALCAQFLVAVAGNLQLGFWCKGCWLVEPGAGS